MKKFLLLFVVLLFSVTSANAVTTYVKYNNAGSPLTITRGYGPAVSAARVYRYGNYARPAHPSVPSRPSMVYGNRNRYAQLPPHLMNYNSPAPVHSVTTTNTTSRFSKDYSVPAPTSYTMNGVTYYN